MKTIKSRFLDLTMERESATITCIWQRLIGKQESVGVSWQKEGFMYALMADCWDEEAESRLTKRGHLMLLVIGACFALSYLVL